MTVSPTASPSQTPVLQVSKATLIRDGVSILQEATWVVEKGQHWAILGANGSGKTSLLKIITGMEWPTVGSIHVLGELYGETHLPELRKKIGWVSTSLGAQIKAEDTAGMVVLSGYDASIGLWRDEFTDEEFVHAAELLRQVGADRIAERPWGVLSQGERQRTLIARALVNHPLILILDEPCAGLDPRARELFLDDLEQLASRPGTPTILLVTHHFEELRPFLTHCLALKEGQIVASGETADVLTQPAMEELFGSPMRIHQQGRAWRLEW